MKKTIINLCFTTFFIGGSMAFYACNSENSNDVTEQTTTVTSHELSVHFILNDGLTPESLTNLKIMVKNNKGMNQTLDIKEGETLKLVQGQYNLIVTGKVKDEAFSIVQGTAEIDLFSNKTASISLHKIIKSTLIFKTIYTSGAKKQYLQDSYFEIVNNSDEMQYLDGLIISAPQGQQKQANAWQANGFENLYANGQGTVIAFPGKGKEYPIKPGESVIIANDAANHKELSGGETKCPNLSNANWEIYLDQVKGDVDYSAPNMKVIFSNNIHMKSFGIGVFGRAYILARCPEGITINEFAANETNLMTTPNTTAKMKFLMIPSAYVLDAVDIWNPNSTTHYPTFLSKDDAKGVLQSDTWSGKCVQRKISKVENGRAYYQDTNNSEADWNRNVDLAF